MVMRIFFTVAGFAAFAYGLYHFSRGGGAAGASVGDVSLYVAFGPATESAVEMELPVTDPMVSRDPPLPGTGFSDPVVWAEKHLQLFDSNGTKLSWRRRGMATYIKGPTAGISDGFLMFDLTPGARYTLKYTPNVADGVTYAGDIVAPTSSERSQEQIALSQL